MAFVADNSVMLAWFVKSQAGAYTWAMLERAAAGEAIHVPLLWRQEFVNAMVVLERRRRLKSADAAQAFADLAQMNFVTDREAVELARPQCHRKISRILRLSLPPSGRIATKVSAPTDLVRHA